MFADSDPADSAAMGEGFDDFGHEFGFEDGGTEVEGEGRDAFLGVSPEVACIEVREAVVREIHIGFDDVHEGNPFHRVFDLEEFQEFLAGELL